MPYRDTYSRNDVIKAHEAEVLTADSNGAGIDLQNRNSALISANIGISGDTLSGTVYVSVELEESADDITYTDVADADMANSTGGGSGQFALIDDPAEDDVVAITGYRGSKRYIRVVFNLTGTHTNGIPVSATVIAEANNQPANNSTFSGS